MDASASRRWPGRLPRVAGGAAPVSREAEQASRLEVEESGPICNFRNFRDLTVNLQ